MSNSPSLLSDVSAAPERPLREAVQLGQVAARVGFDWPDAQSAFQKIEEELGEVGELLPAPNEPVSELDADRRAALLGEVGDLLFSVCMVARLLQIDPEAALQSTNAKFRARFAAIERELQRRGLALEEATLEEMERIWQAAKT